MSGSPIVISRLTASVPVAPGEAHWHDVLDCRTYFARQVGLGPKMPDANSATTTVSMRSCQCSKVLMLIRYTRIARFREVDCSFCNGLIMELLFRDREKCGVTTEIMELCDVALNNSRSVIELMRSPRSV